MRQLADQVYVFPFMGSFINIYLIETPDGLLLSDTGTSPAQMDQIAAELKRSGRSITDIHHIFITHAHNDHIGGLHHLQKLLPPTVRTYAHRREAAIIRGEAPMLFAAPDQLGGIQRLIRNFMPTTLSGAPSRVDTEVKAGDTVAGLLEVIELPGHAYGQCGLLWREKGILFGGDVMMRLPWGLARPFEAASPDPKAVIASIHQVDALKLKMLCICHGAPLMQDTAATIRAFARKLPV